MVGILVPQSSLHCCKHCLVTTISCTTYTQHVGHAAGVEKLSVLWCETLYMKTFVSQRVNTTLARALTDLESELG